jgi:hypothetical protein
VNDVTAYGGAMLSDDTRTELLDLLLAMERLTDDKQRADLDGEPEVVNRMLAVTSRIDELCLPLTDSQPAAFTPLDTARPFPDLEGGTP